MQYFVAVVSSTGKPLMPTSNRKANKLISRGQLHRLQPESGGVRKTYGGTLSLGFKRGSWVKHPKWGVCYIGGSSNNRLSLHSLQDGKRLTQDAKPEDCVFLTFCSWRVRKEQGAIATHA
jgi:hypothetical protein